MPTDGATVPSVASILVVFFAFGVATSALLWLMDMLADALRSRTIDRGDAYPRARWRTTTEPERVEPSPAPGEAQGDTRRSWWRRLFGD